MLELHELSVEIAGQSVCRDVALTVEPSQTWGVLGGNGVGKTTLLHTVAGLRAPASGSILLNGRRLDAVSARERACQLGLLFQDHEDPFPTTVMETALIGRHPHLSPWAWESDADIDIARTALRAMQLEALDHRDVTTLSGGERQRLAIATLLTQDPQLLLLDEPTNHLDLHHQIQLLEFMRERVSANRGACLMTLHDVNLAARYCSHVMLLFGDGRAELGTVDELLDCDTLTRLYRHPIVKVSSQTGSAYVPA